MTKLGADHVQIPDPPVGYGAPVEFKYPYTALIIANLVLAVALLPALGVLTWWLQGRPDNIDFRFGLVEPLLLLFVIPLTLIMHELIHGVVLRLLGYRVSYGIFWRMGAYAAAFRQFITRNHNLVVALAPLVVLTVLLVPLLALPQQLIVIPAFMALLLNTSGAVGDIYLAWRLARLPAATLFYDVNIKYMLLYPPAPDEADSELAHEHE